MHSSAYQFKALQLVNLTAPSLSQSAHQGYAGISRPLHPLKAKDLMMDRVIRNLKSDRRMICRVNHTYLKL